MKNKQSVIAWSKSLLSKTDQYANEGFSGFFLALQEVDEGWILGLDWLNDICLGELILGKGAYDEAILLRDVAQSIFKDHVNIYLTPIDYQNAIRRAGISQEELH